MIGIFDSGVGGLTVVRALKVARPDLSFVYLGDTARMPYGTKSRDTIKRYSREAVSFLMSQGAKTIIIACNTASSLATAHLRKQFPKTPIFDVISPAVNTALKTTDNNKVGVIGTRATISSGVYEQQLRALRPEIKVFSNSAPLLVSLVEEGWIDTPETVSIVGKYIAPIRDEGIDTLILGCTHYPILKKEISDRVGEGVKLIDSAETAVKAFCDTLDENSSLNRVLRKKGESSFFVTDTSPQFGKLASEWLGGSVSVRTIKLDQKTSIWTH